MGGQFSDLVTAVYCLYSEGDDGHSNIKRPLHRYQHDWDETEEGLHTITTAIEWDEEGRFVDITLVRRDTDWCRPTPDSFDPVDVELTYWRGTFRYTVDGRDLCYAVARACTEALKKYGFWGYHYSSGNVSCGDNIDINRFLFLKAYALNAMEVRVLAEKWRKPKSWMSADASCFQEEMELLLFDM